MKITVCIGSACHMKGSREIVETLQHLIAENNLKDKIDLGGTFCMGRCKEGVCVKLDEEFFSLKPENTKAFFDKEVLGRL